MQEIDPESERPSQQSATIPQRDRAPIVFCSFSATPQDRRLAGELERHLQALVRRGTIRLADRFSLPIGSLIDAETRRLLDEARLILLLVSADYLSDPHCCERELPRALERQREGTAQVLVVRLRAVDLEATPLADPSLMTLPSDGRPLAQWRHRDAALREIAATVRTLLTAPPVVESGRLPRPGHAEAQPSTRLAAALTTPPRYADMPSRERENRRAFLHIVEETWIRGVLAHSLFQETALSLGLRELPEALENPWRLVVQESERPPRPLPAGTSITEVFDESRDGAGEGASDLLLLGEPGAGKTTLLLLLLRELLRRAEGDERVPMPVYFALSTWSSWRGRRYAIGRRLRLFRKGADDVAEEALSQRAAEFEAWLMEELREKYRVPVRVASDWLRAERLTLLLDGLDEVSAAARSSCLQAINAYRLLHPTVSIVLAGRREEYFALESRAALRRAVLITPLTDEQVAEYLVRAGPRLAGLRAALQADEELRALAQMPLMLQVLMLTYDGLPREAVLGLSGLPSSERYRSLFTLYVERMFARRARPRFSLADTQRWLRFLALQMKRHGQTVFYMERLQPDWITDSLKRFSYRLQVIACTTVLSSFIGYLTGWFVGHLLGALILLSAFGIVGLLLSLFNRNINILVLPKNSFKKIDQWFIIAVLTITGTFIGGIGSTKLVWMGFLTGAIFGFGYGYILGPIATLESELLDLSSIQTPNEGIRGSMYRLILLFAFDWLYIQFCTISINNQLSVAMAGGVGLLGALSLGGLSCIQHYLLRLTLWRSKALPWNLLAFLNHACERILLQRAGGGYLFVHRLLLDYFAHL